MCWPAGSTRPRVGATAADSIVIAPATTGTMLVVLAQPALAAAVYTFLAAWNGHPTWTARTSTRFPDRGPDAAGTPRTDRSPAVRAMVNRYIAAGRPPLGPGAAVVPVGSSIPRLVRMRCRLVGIDVVAQRGGVDPAQLGDGEGRPAPARNRCWCTRAWPAAGGAPDRRSARGPARSAAGRRPGARRCPPAAADRRPAAPGRGIRWPPPGLRHPVGVGEHPDLLEVGDPGQVDLLGQLPGRGGVDVLVAAAPDRRAAPSGRRPVRGRVATAAPAGTPVPLRSGRTVKTAASTST